MTMLQVRNVPEALYTRLKQRAAAQNRSLSSEVIVLLEWAIVEVERDSEASLAAIRRRRFFSPEAAGAPDSTTLLREDRAR